MTLVAGMPAPALAPPLTAEPLPRGTARSPEFPPPADSRPPADSLPPPPAPPPRRWSAQDGRSGASRRITAPLGPLHGLAPELPEPIEPPDDEPELEDELGAEELDDPLDELPSPPRGTAEPTVSPVFGRDCGAAKVGATEPRIRAAPRAPTVNV